MSIKTRNSLKITSQNISKQSVRNVSRESWEQKVLKNLEKEDRPNKKETDVAKPKFLPVEKEYINLAVSNTANNLIRNGIVMAVWDALTDFGHKYDEKLDYLQKALFLSRTQCEKIINGNFNK